MDEIKKFNEEKKANIQKLSQKQYQDMGVDFVQKTASCQYSYNFTWLGRPIIQFPQDMVALQEIIWDVKPDCIIETGIAHGGSLIFSASMLTLLESCNLADKTKVIGIDIDIRAHNKDEIQKHPLSKKITMLEGSSIDEKIIQKVKELSKDSKKILVLLDSNHTHKHVLQELYAYAPLVTKGSYCIVYDTGIEDMPSDAFLDRPWGKGDNPKTAVKQFLKECSEFKVDKDIENKLLITVCPEGYLKRI